MTGTLRARSIFLCALALLPVLSAGLKAADPLPASFGGNVDETVTVVFAPRREAKLATDVSERIVEITREFGGAFTAGETLVRLDAEMFERQRDKAAAALELAKANLDAAEERYRTKAAQRQAEARLAVARAELNQVKQLQDDEVYLRKVRATMNVAKENFEAVERLHRDGEASGQQLAEARRDMELARANLEITRASRGTNLESARQKVTSAELDLELAKASMLPAVVQARHDLAVAEANLAIAKKNLAACTLHAPFDGSVKAVLTQQHELVQRGQTILHIIDDSVLLAQFLIPSEVDREIAIGREVSIHVYAIEGEVTGRISHISASADAASDTVEVRAEVENPERALRSGWRGEFPLAAIRDGE